MMTIIKNSYGQIMMILSSLAFAISAIFVKYISNTLSSKFIALIRFIVGILLIFIFIKLQKKVFAIKNKKVWILRGFFGFFSMLFFFYSIQFSTSSRATLISNTFPIFTFIFGYLFFKQRITLLNILSSIICISGIFIVSGESIINNNLQFLKGDILAILSSVFAGMATHYVKQVSMNDDPLYNYLPACILGLTLFPFSLNEFKLINLNNLIILIIIGVLTFLGQLFLAKGYQHINVLEGSLYTYLKIPFTAILSMIFLKESFTLQFVIGALLIICGIIISNEKLFDKSTHKEVI